MEAVIDRRYGCTPHQNHHSQIIQLVPKRCRLRTVICDDMKTNGGGYNNISMCRVVIPTWQIGRNMRPPPEQIWQRPKHQQYSVLAHVFVEIRICTRIEAGPETSSTLLDANVY